MLSLLGLLLLLLLLVSSLSIFSFLSFLHLSVFFSIRMSEDRDKWRKYVHGVANPRIEDGQRSDQIRSAPSSKGVALSDTAIRPSVRLSHGAAALGTTAALGYRHAGCLQLSHERTAGRSADGRRSAASRTVIGGRGYIVSPPPGDNLFY